MLCVVLHRSVNMQLSFVAKSVETSVRFLNDFFYGEANSFWNDLNFLYLIPLGWCIHNILEHVTHLTVPHCCVIMTNLENLEQL